jgi:hypothetical protein
MPTVQQLAAAIGWSLLHAAVWPPIRSLPHAASSRQLPSLVLHTQPAHTLAGGVPVWVPIVPVWAPCAVVLAWIVIGVCAATVRAVMPPQQKLMRCRIPELRQAWPRSVAPGALLCPARWRHCARRWSMVAVAMAVCMCWILCFGVGRLLFGWFAAQQGEDWEAAGEEAWRRWWPWSTRGLEHLVA